jgi:hypothetical protein
MGNVSGNAYALTALSPIKAGIVEGEEIAYADAVRYRLESWNREPNSPMARVPQTYLCRYFVLDDVYTQSLPGAGILDTLSDLLPVVPDSIRRAVLPKEDHLASRYIVFSSNFYGGPKADLDGYLRGMWNAMGDRIKEIWGYCYGFEKVDSAESFAAYMRRCQLEVSLFFNGSTDKPLEQQLKSLYLKQEFARFAVANQGLSAAELRANYREFVERVAPKDLTGPTWSPGQYRL